MISLNSPKSLSEYLCVGPVEGWYILASRTDLVNSGSYFTEFLVVVFGITIFKGLGGSFLMTGFTLGLIDTNDLGSIVPGFFTTAFGASGTATALTAGFAVTTACPPAGRIGFAAALVAGLAPDFATGLVTVFDVVFTAF